VAAIRSAERFAGGRGTAPWRSQGTRGSRTGRCGGGGRPGGTAGLRRCNPGGRCRGSGSARSSGRGWRPNWAKGRRRQRSLLPARGPAAPVLRAGGPRHRRSSPRRIKAGLRVYLLPEYGHDLNPAESVWSHLKRAPWPTWPPPTSTARPHRQAQTAEDPVPALPDRRMPCRHWPDNRALVITWALQVRPG
jgi:hypothetical protein